MNYLLTQCPYCDGRIEFPADGIGRVIDCPHCKKPFELGSTETKKSAPKEPAWLYEIGVLFNQKNKNFWLALTVFGAALAGILITVNDNGRDYQAHPLAAIIGATVPAFVIGAVLYWRNNRNKAP